MKKRAVLAILVLCVLVLFHRSCAYKGRPSRGLQLHLSISPGPYKVGEPLPLHLTLTNIGSAVVHLPSERWDFRKYFAHYMTGYRSAEEGTYGLPRMPPFQSHGTVVSELKPGETVDIDLDPLVVKKPSGKVRVFAEVMIGDRSIDRHPLIPPGYTGWTGRLWSNDVTIAVGP